MQIALPLFLLSFAIVVFLYGLFLKVGRLSPPQLQREQVQVQGLLSAFERLYPQEKEEKTDSISSVRLLATASGSVKLALAVVDGKAKALRVGSTVGGYRVVDIQRNYIVLARDENRFVVGFSFGAGGASEPSSGSFSSVPQASKSLQAVIPRGELNRITADPGVMFKQIRLVPFVQDGRTRGFLFEWVEPGSIFDRAGIKPGDILLSINNQEIRSGEDAFRILQVLRNENTIKLNLQRGGELIELSLRVE